MKVARAADLVKIRHGAWVRVAGAVIVRQRPGTAKGFVFLNLEDESGLTNVIVRPALFHRHRLALVNEPFLFVEGTLQQIYALAGESEKLDVLSAHGVGSVGSVVRPTRRSAKPAAALAQG